MHALHPHPQKAVIYPLSAAKRDSSLWRTAPLFLLYAASRGEGRPAALSVDPRIQPARFFLLHGRLGRRGRNRIGHTGIRARAGIDRRLRTAGDNRRHRTGIGRCHGRGLADIDDAVARFVVAVCLKGRGDELAVAGVDVAVGLDLVAGIGGLLDEKSAKYVSPV